jgi:acetylornithine deacetylase
VVHGALGRELQEWRPAQVADYVRLSGSGRYATGQTEEGAVADMRAELDALERRFPALRATITTERANGRPTMPSFEVRRDSPIVQAINRAYRVVRGEDQPTGAITPPGYYGTDAGHLQAVGGMEGIVCGPGGRYNTMPDERVDIGDFLDMVRIYLLTILEICEAA